jgi:hypothetical protein
MALVQEIAKIIQDITQAEETKQDVIATSQAAHHYLLEEEGYKAIMHRDNTLCLPVVMVLKNFLTHPSVASFTAM